LFLKNLLTPKQVARAIGASESSLKRWCDKGILPTVRTAGGHRRLELGGVLAFLRKSGQALVRPEVLGLPATVGQGEATLERASARLQRALLAGDEQQCRGILFDLYLAGRSAVDICDSVLGEGMHGIGFQWECGEADVYEEHRACEICLRLVYDLRLALPAVPPTAPLAIGGAIAGDPYRLPITMVEVTLREAGWNAASLGPNLPIANMCASIERTRPQLFWLSASVIPAIEDFLAGYQTLFETATRSGAALVVGGKALTPDVRRQMQYSAFCDNLRHLVSFIATLPAAMVELPPAAE